jgi:hypothetical protein
MQRSIVRLVGAACNIAMVLKAIKTVMLTAQA